MVVCFAEQRVGLCAQTVEPDFAIGVEAYRFISFPTFILRTIRVQTGHSMIAAWAGSIGIILGFLRVASKDRSSRK